MTDQSTRTRDLDGSRYTTALTVVTAGGCGYLVLMLWTMYNSSFDVWGALFVAPVLAAITWLTIGRAAQTSGDHVLRRLLPVAFAAKLAGTALRFLVIEGVYHGTADASGYHGNGVRIASQLRQGDFDLELGRVVGTGFVKLLTGIVYAIIGPSRLGGFVVFSWFAFVGMVLFYKAFTLAVPGGDRRRYALLVLFMPSLLFWPSSIGKEAWMVLALGTASYGAARVLTHRPGGFTVLAVGLAASAAVRPHVTLALFLALPIAYLLRRPEQRSPANPVVKAVGLTVLLVVGIVVVGRVESYFRIDELDTESLEEVLSKTELRNTDDGSSFTAARPSNPAEFPVAAVTVLFRPFPHEAHNPQALSSAVEGVFLMGFVLVSLPRFRYLVRVGGRHSYIALATIYLFLFVVAFSSFGNFGLLARQRVQVLPFLFVLLAAAREVKSSDSPNALTEGDTAPTFATPSLARR